MRLCSWWAITMPAEASVYASPVARHGPVPQVIKSSLAGQVQTSTWHKGCSFYRGDPKPKAVYLEAVPLSLKYCDYGCDQTGVSLCSGWCVHPGHIPATVRWLNTKEDKSCVDGLLGALWCSSSVCCPMWRKRMHSAMHISSPRTTLQDTEWCKDCTEIFLMHFHCYKWLWSKSSCNRAFSSLGL